MTSQKKALLWAAGLALAVLAGVFLLPQRIAVPADVRTIVVSDQRAGSTAVIDDPGQVERILPALSALTLRFKGAFSYAETGSLLSISCLDSAGEQVLFLRVLDEGSLLYCGADYWADLSDLLPLLAGE